jgi:MFS family permease
MSPLVTVILLVWVVGAIFAAGAIGNRKGRSGTGFLLGLFLGWIGVIIIAFIPPTREMLVLRERERQQIQREATESMRGQSPPGSST